VSTLLALQFVAFGWRINREIPLGDQGRRTWFPLPDWINILSFGAVIATCVVMPLLLCSSAKTASMALGVGYTLIAFHPVSEAAHYRLFSKAGRSVYVKTPKGDYPWITGQEITSVVISLIVSAGVLLVGISK
jgi:hypothetical protein